MPSPTVLPSQSVSRNRALYPSAIPGPQALNKLAQGKRGTSAALGISSHRRLSPNEAKQLGSQSPSDYPRFPLLPSRPLLIAVAVVGLLMSGVHARAENATAVRYNRDVLPILAENCFACHGF